MSRGAASRGLSAVLALALWGCGEADVPGRAVEITGNTITYRSQPTATTVADRFSWNNTADQAYVRFDSTALTAGKAQVTFLDADGRVVLERSIVPSTATETGPTAQGKAGGWTVRVEFTEATGIVAFEAQASR